MVVLKPGIVTISVAIGIAGWTSRARIIRGRVLQLRDQEFTLASRSLGAGKRTHPLQAPAAQRPRAHRNHADADHPLGHLLRGGPELYRARYSGTLGLARVPHKRRLCGVRGSTLTSCGSPPLVFSLLMLSFNLLADGLRDALDPRMRK